MPVLYSENDKTKTAEIVIQGRITRQDFNNVSKRLEGFIARHGKVKLIEKIDDYKGFEMSALGPSLAFNFRNWSKISHCAVLSNTPLMGAFVKASNAMSPIDIKSYKNTAQGLKAARKWTQSV